MADTEWKGMREMETEEKLVREIAAGLLKWYPFSKNAAVLCIGDAEEKALSYVEGTGTEAVYVSYARLESGEGTEEWRNFFDYIVIVEDIEKHRAPGAILVLAKAYLKPEGILLLGMNNRLGVRYFCGDRDPYTGRNFDGIEDYRHVYARQEDSFAGRMYDQARIREMLKTAGFGAVQFYAVMPDLQNPFLIYARDYLPNEDLSNRLFPLYHYPDTVFLEEEGLYQSLLDNDMFHKMANAWIIECGSVDRMSDVLHVTASLERGVERALYTVIKRSGEVEKRAVYPEGKKHLAGLAEHESDLRAHGVSVLAGEFEEGVYRMPYVKAESGQLYLKRLLLMDKECFLKEMDRFRDVILHSSEIVREDQGDGEGAVLRRGYLDLVPLNSFYMDGQFVFYDQEFCMEECPANLLFYRMVASFYVGNYELNGRLPMQELLERYGLTRHLTKWQRLEWEFLGDLRNAKALAPYHRIHQRNNDLVHMNRQRMNYSVQEYEKRFVNIFENADTRKLILFGSGIFAEHFLKIYGKDYEVCAIVDNASSRWGMKVGGVTVQSPDILRQFDSGEYKVIICIKNYLSVMKQLEEMGVGDYAVYERSRSYPRNLTFAAPAASAGGAEQEKKKYHVGYVAGAFDMFHAGHLNLLRRAKEQCDYLIAGILPDERIRELKGREPVIPLEDRVEIVAACRYVDHAEGLPEEYSGIKEAYRMFHFDVQFSGDDHHEDEAWLADKEFLEKQGADVVFIPYTQRISSTMLREQLAEGQSSRPTPN